MAHQILTLLQRFLSKVSPMTDSGCALWVGHITRSGHGGIGVPVPGMGYRWPCRLAHRVAWELFVGAIPKGKSVLHKCDNPGCVNTAHLYLGTQSDNMRDVAVRSRGSKSRAGLPYGVSMTRGKKMPYRASVTCRRKQKFLGHFDSIEAAHTAAMEYKKTLYLELREPNESTARD